MTRLGFLFVSLSRHTKKEKRKRRIGGRRRLLVFIPVGVVATDIRDIREIGDIRNGPVRVGLKVYG